MIVFVTKVMFIVLTFSYSSTRSSLTVQDFPSTSVSQSGPLYNKTTNSVLVQRSTCHV